MAVYEYEHIEKACKKGKVFEFVQSMDEKPLEICPTCGAPVKKLISLTRICIPVSNTTYREKGFTKLVRREDGVYENVTRRDGESRFMERDNPASVPDLSKIITD
jgi:putative FmdB family regulatory protein